MPNRRQFLLWGSQSLAAGFLASKVSGPHPDHWKRTRLIPGPRFDLFVVTNVDYDAKSIIFLAVPRE